MQLKRFGASWLIPLVTGCMYVFLYAPIAILIVISFNASQYSRQWAGFSLKWYYAVFQSAEVWDAVYNSLVVATASVFLSVSMGVALVMYAARTRLKHTFVLFYASLAVPEIIVAVGLLTVFAFCSIPFSLFTIIIGHTLLGLGYVVPIVYDRFRSLDFRLAEASMDLGATKTQTLFKIIIPLLSPAIIGAGLLVFIVSLDDFLIAFFCSASSAQTLPIFLFSMIRAGEYTLVNAISVVLLFATVLLVSIFYSLNINKTEMMQ